MSFLGTFQDTAIVYPGDPSTGEYSTPVKEDLRCRVIAPQIRPVDVGRERNELTDLRYLTYDPLYTFPTEYCQVKVRDVKYNTVAGTFRNIRNPVGKLMLKRVDIVRVTG